MAARPLELLYKAVAADMGRCGRALREEGWPAELQVDTDGDDHFIVSLRVRVGPDMQIPVEARTKPLEPISDGQRRAFHAKANDLDGVRESDRGLAKTQALAAAGERFGRPISSSNDLSSAEASWVLDYMEAQLDQAVAQKAAPEPVRPEPIRPSPDEG